MSALVQSGHFGDNRRHDKFSPLADVVGPNVAQLNNAIATPSQLSGSCVLTVTKKVSSNYLPASELRRGGLIPIGDEPCAQ